MLSFLIRLKEYLLSKKILLVFVGILFSTFVFELLFNYWLTHKADKKYFAYFATHKQALLESRHERHHYLGYIPKISYTSGNNSHNSLGFRGSREIEIPKPDNTYRIVTLGGSTTYTSDVLEDNFSYPHLMEENFLKSGYEDVEVINAGDAGYTTWETLMNLQFRVLDLEPDLIVVYHAINDVDARIVTPESYKGDNSGSLTYYTKPSDSLLSNLAFSRIISTISENRTTQGGIWSLRHVSDTYLGNNLKIQYFNKTYPSDYFAETSLETLLKENKPKYFEKNLKSVIAIAKEHGIDVTFATFAWSKEYENVITALPAYAQALNEHNTIIVNICKEHELKCFDFNKYMPEDKKYYTDGHHVTKEGAQVKANLFSDFLISCGLLDEKINTESDKCTSLLTTQNSFD